MRELSDKVHMLATMKHDYDINVRLERDADKHTDRMSAEFSAFFVGHSKDDHIDKNILRKSPNSSDLTRLKKLAAQLPKQLETDAKRRKMAYLSMGVSDMEMYVQSLVGLLMLPMAIDSLNLMEKTLHDEFTHEYKRQADDLGMKNKLPVDKVNELSHKSFDSKTPQKAFWTSFDKSLANLSVELIRAIQQGVSSQEWAIITGGK